MFRAVNYGADSELDFGFYMFCGPKATRIDYSEYLTVINRAFQSGRFVVDSGIDYNQSTNYVNGSQNRRWQRPL